MSTDTRLQITRRISALQCLFRLDARYGTAVARVELAPVKLAVIFGDARGAARHPPMVQIIAAAASATLNIEIGPAARHRVATAALPIKVDIDLGDGAAPAILTLVIQALSLPLSERLLLLVLEV